MPAIVDGDFVLFESHAILRYLQGKYGKTDHWYPSTDLAKRAKIDQYLDWHHTNLRVNATGYLVYRFMIPIVKRKQQGS